MTESVPLYDRVARTIQKHRMLEEATSVMIGVSGGADSVCLLRVLVELADLSGFQLAIAHFNHLWRGNESDGDEYFVTELATRFNLELFVQRSESQVEGANTEAAAREERWRFFNDISSKRGFDKIAVAHTRDDRAETFFLNLMRGTGTDGLVAMRPASGNVIRPLIETTKADIETYLGEIDQDWRRDSTNADIRFTRNKIRHNVLPSLAAEFNPRLPEALSRTIDILSDEDDWMEQSVAQWLSTRVSDDGTDLVVQIGDLESQPVGLVRRVLRAALRLSGSSMLDIGYDHIESVRALLKEGKSGRMIELPGSIGVERNYDSLRFFPDSPVPGDYEYQLPIPGQVEVREIGTVFEARLADPDASGTGKPNGDRVFVDGEFLGRYVKIRNWKSGDFYNPDGLSPSKLKTLFQKERIPRRKRRQWPVLVAESSIVWVASFPVSRDFVPTRRTRRVVEFETSHILR